MASTLIQTATAVLTEIATIALDLQIDQVELASGALVKVGQVASLNGKPVYVYISENPAAV